MNVTYDFFMFTDPDIDITSSIIIYPSFTIKSRFRSDFNFRVRWEIFNNFTLNLKYYFNYDNQPPSVDAYTVRLWYQYINWIFVLEFHPVFFSNLAYLIYKLANYYFIQLPKI